MSMAGLRYCPSSPSGPLETKSGAYVYSGDPSHFHEWQFRTLLRVELCKKKMEQKAKEKAKEASSSPVSPASSGRRRREPTEAAEQEDAEETAAEVSPQAPSGEHSAGLGGFASPRSQEEHDLLDVSPYVELVTKVMEGLRGDAFLMAKDLGLNALMDVGPPTGLELLVEKIKEHVFPLRSHEARELFRLGQQANGPLSRQSAETILSFIGRRKRWWIQLKELDPEMAISTQMRAELLLETSGPSRQEQLMVKTACPKPSFEGYSEILLEHHGRIHLRDSRNLAPPSRPFQPKGAGKNKGKGWYRSGYIAGEYNDHGGDEAADDGDDYNWNEDYDNGAYVGYGDEPSTEDPDDCDWVSDEDLGIALTAMAACDMDETSTEGLEELGEACQHQLQAYAAVGRQTPSQGKVGYLALSDSSGDDDLPCVVIEAGTKKKSRENPMDDMSLPAGSDHVFTFGQHKGYTYHEVLMQYPGYYVWGRNEPGTSRILNQFLDWVDMYYDVDHGTLQVTPKVAPEAVQPRPSPVPGSKHKTAARKPPNPPVEIPGHVCRDFMRWGSNAYVEKKTCRECGKVTVTPKNPTYAHDPETCTHAVTDKRGSTKSTSRTFCLLCGTHVDEMPRDEGKRREALGRAVSQSAAPLVDLAEDLLKYERLELLLNTEDTVAVMHQFQHDCEIELEHDHHMRASVMVDILRNAIEAVMEARETTHAAYMALSPLEDELECDALPVVDVLNDEHVWGVLDEGCNSTVCGHDWMESCKAKLKKIGFDAAMQSEEQKAFKGLAGNVRTKGRYRIPFALEPEGGKKLPCVLETYVVGEPGDPTPLLLSQHAQAALGLVKDMATSTCTLGRNGPTLKLHRTKDSGLLCVCLSKGLISMSFRQTPTQIRELRTPDNMAYVSTTPRTMAPSGQQVLIYTAGKDFCPPLDAYCNDPSARNLERLCQNFGLGDREVFVVDTLELGDPHHDKSLRSHIGTHPDILAGLVRNDWTMQVMHALVRRVKEAVDENKAVAVIAYCRRNRHRSVALGWLVSCALEFLQVSCSLTHANARTSWQQMSGGCRGRCEHCQHENADAKTEAEDHAGKLCDLARCEMTEKDMAVLDDVCEVRGIGLAPVPKAAPSAPAPRAPRPRAPPEPSRVSSASAAARPAPASRPPPMTPPRRSSPRRRTPTPPRRSRSPPKEGQQTEALIARISELTTVVSQLVAERDQARASASSTYRSRRSRSDSRDSRRRGRSRSPRESRYGEAPWRREVSYRRPRTPPRPPPRRSPSPLPRRRPPARQMSVESVMAGWPSHLDLPAREDDGTSWNKRVDAHGLSVELLDAMWYAAAVDHQSGYKQKCLRWIGPYFPGTTAEERKVQIVEQNNMAANVKVAVLGPDYIGMCLQEETSSVKGLRKSWASPSMRVEGWSVTIYDYIDRSWTVDGTYPVESELEYQHESTGRILVYAPTREAETTPPDDPGDAGDAGDNGDNGDGNNEGDGHEDGQDEEQKENDDVEEITDESTHLAMAEDGGVEETMETQEPMDVIEEVPTAHAAVTAPKEETPEQKTPELKALGVVEGTPEKLAMPHFAKALTMHPSKYIDLNSDDDHDPSGATGSDAVATAVKLEVKTEHNPCALLGALMSSESRVMDKKDKSVVTSGLKIMQHEDEVMKAMVGISHLQESVHMLVLKDPTINLSSWNDVHVMTVDPNWDDTCKKLAARVSSQSPGLVAVYMESPTWKQIQDVHCEADMNQCTVVVFTPYLESLVDKGYCFGGDLCLFVAGDRNDALFRLAVDWNESQESMAPRTFQDACGMEFHELLKGHSEKLYLDRYAQTCFVGEAMDEQSGSEDQMLDDPNKPLTPAENEQLILDQLAIPGAPLDEAQRRAQWRALPTRTRIAIRRLHRQFGHPTPATLKNILKAGRASPELIEAARLVRCQACEDTAKPPRDHPVGSHFNYEFNSMLGFDVLEMRDHLGNKYSVMSMVDIATGFHMCEVVKEGGGQPTSEACAKALMTKWIAWAGWPKACIMDRGLHNRGAVTKMLASHGCNIEFAPLETPAAIGKVERHGGILKAMVRKVVADTETAGLADFEMLLQECTSTKNSMQRTNGYSASQWVLGKQPRMPGSVTDMSESADLGVIEAKTDPTVAYHKVHAARMSAQRAFVHLDTSNRVARALTRNAAPQHKEYLVGDLVCYRRDAQQGGTTWSTASRVIGHDPHNGLWLLHEGVPILCSTARVRSANESEALAFSILNGEPVLPDAIVSGPQQQKYIHLEDEQQGPKFPNPVGIFSDDEGAPQGSSAPSRAPATPGRRSKTKDKTGQSERPGPYTRAAPMTPGALPGDTMLAELVDGDHWRISKDVAIRVHAEPRKREYNTMVDGELPEGFQDSGFATVRKIFRNGDVKTNETGKVSNVEETDAWTGFTVFRKAQDPFERARAMDLELDLEPLRSFIAQRIVEAEETVQSGKVAKTVDIRKVSPEIRALMMEARTAEWEKYKSFNAAIPIWGKELQNLLDEGHKVIPSKWVETDKHEHLKGAPEYSPKMKARLVICGNFEDVSREDVRCDAPTADAESHCLLASWAASEKLRLKGSDVTNAYFQAKPLTRLLLMRQPTGGLGDPDVPAEACLLCRVPIYGSIDAGRGFYLRMDSEVKTAGMNASKVMPALYYHQDENGELDAMLCTHVDDLLFAHKPSGAKVIEEILGKFSVGKTEEGSFRYCGRRFTQHDDFTIEIDAEENTRGIKPIWSDKSRKGTDVVTEKELTSLRSVTGSLAWVARYCRADLAYKVNELQRLCNSKATVSDLRLANKAVELAHQNQNMKLVHKANWIDWKDLAVVTYSDASFANEPGYKSQQGRTHHLTTASRLTEKDHSIHVIGFASSTLKRVCRATLQAESYALQSAVEHGDRLRCVLCELTGKLATMTDWHEQCQVKMKHVWVSDCMSLVEHLNAEVPKKVQDKRLGIELAALRQSLWTGNGQKSCQEYAPCGDELWWTETAKMLADALTKSMRPDLLVRVVQTGRNSIA
ncbi:unnamed protein product [Cladocopium goreaui]|uniref:Integrase catalytic domain-containing protein n=1 Tax=Cladocopium goreaui TaxID=2562237 RepID=A0A9P1BLV9_9DINO|nr:unnamed protein product [Cladocopium goreaui]